MHPKSRSMAVCCLQSKALSSALVTSLLIKNMPSNTSSYTSPMIGANIARYQSPPTQYLGAVTQLHAFTAQPLTLSPEYLTLNF